jgi:hypothetical protein
MRISAMDGGDSPRGAIATGLVFKEHDMNGTRRSTTGTFSTVPAKSAHKTLGRSAAPTAAEPLTFAAADLAPPPGVGPPDNLLLGGAAPTSTQGRDLILTLPYPASSEPEAGDTVELVIDNVDLPGTAVVFDDTGADITFTLFDADHAVAGKHTLNYHIKFITGGSNEEFGPPGQSFIVDYDPPGFPDLSDIEFDFATEDGLTPENLDGNGDLPAHVFGYAGLAVDDRIILIIDGDESTTASIVDHIPLPGDPIRVVYPKVMIDALSDGTHEFTYRAEDRAGNTSEPAAPTTMTSLIKGFIDDLVAPTVEQSAAPLVDDAVARSDGGVTVAIPAHAKLGSTYTAVIYWGSKESDRFAIPAGAQDPVTSRVIPYGIVYDEWNAVSTGNDQAVAVDVWYEIFLNDIRAGESPKVSVDVNLYLAGGTDPDPVTPVHESLVAPTVKSSGGGSDNLIPIEDFDKDGTVVIPFLTSATPSAAAFVAGDIITVQYGIVTLFTYTVTPADITNAVDIPIVLRKEDIAAAGTGTISATYSITHAIAGGDGSGTNISLSPAQAVAVFSAGELPGNGATLDAATWSNAGGKTTVGPIEARTGVDIEIPGYANKKKGDFITVSLVMFPRFVHTDGDTAVDPPRTATRSYTVQDTDASPNLPSKVTFTYDQLMYFGQTPLTMHAHIDYKVRGFETAVDVGSNMLYLRVDCRGEEP